mgnify:CR=1 FL=1
MSPQGPTAVTDAMTQLALAALADDAEKCVGLLSGDVPLEMPAVALSRAIAAGSQRAALALAGWGVTLSPYPEAVAIPGDTLVTRCERVRGYLTDLLTLGNGRLEFCERRRPRCPAEGQGFAGALHIHAISRASGPALVELLDAGLLTERDRAGLMLVAANYWVSWQDEWFFEMAVLLARSLEGVPSYPTIDFKSCGAGDFVTSDLFDLGACRPATLLRQYLPLAARVAREGGVLLSYQHLASCLVGPSRHPRYESELRAVVGEIGLDLFGGGPLPRRPHL